MSDKLDLLLINPKCWVGPPPAYLPYGILWLASFLRSHGISVKIFDHNVDKRNILDVIRDTQPSIVGLSVLTGPVIKDAICISKGVKSLLPNSKVVWGGLHSTIFPEYVLKNNYVDYVIIGEGEIPLLELAEKILRDKNKLEDIKSIAYKINNNVVINSKRDFIKDLDTLPDPAWDLVNIENYTMQKFYSKRVITLNTSRGCPHRCAFCYNQAVNKRVWRGLSAERVFKQIIYLKERYNISGFQIYDDEFDVNKERVRKICELIIKNKIKIAFAHFSRVNVANKEIYRLEKEAGLKHIEFGVESGSQRILNFIQKDQTLEMIKKAFAICSELHITASALFMTGLPTETEEDLKMTINFLKNLKAHQTIDTLFRPFPATELFDYCVKEGLFKLPGELEKQAEIFDYQNGLINVSKVPNNRLIEVHRYFMFNNIKNEILEALKYFNFSLIWFYIKRKINLQNLSYFFVGLKVACEQISGKSKKATAPGSDNH